MGAPARGNAETAAICDPASGVGSLAAAAGADHARFAIVFALAGWAVPGLGHALLGRWGRALGFFVAVGGLVIAGALMGGLIFSMATEDPFGRIGFYSQAASGVFYAVARWIEPAGTNLSRAAGEFGTRFIATGGVVNLLSMLDAFEIARGRRK
ncbi:MAG TPA: DUF6677 family protein [Candidatus Acidoferrales bacterium]|nr:DUF6677 family protein [Candidatus Acidoferrales bacterium]